MIISIEGCIGSGKTTTAQLLADTLQWSLLTEQSERHPFLEDFYKNPMASALQTELGFVLLHYHQLQTVTTRSNIVTDFSIVKDLVFGRMNLEAADLQLFEHV